MGSQSIPRNPGFRALAPNRNRIPCTSERAPYPIEPSPRDARVPLASIASSGSQHGRDIALVLGVAVCILGSPVLSANGGAMQWMAHDGGVAESLVAYWPRLGPCPPNHGPPPSERVRIRVLCLCLSHSYAVSSLHF
ncbi:hypothetical protein M431DRAFT_490556 [Trichoderma harzianum CBS 226.95]|uniref:Uncharacterized protein n=1 Tax=Trichoderma harzianum CBS 226.95 TaxID=983964 RepID=A0A2T4APC0_TRIHA|nr:hypothetical protein M431DRAFT_490556 [Trichoderma harzianum CBS 226.95]PTB58922.1 hypothetical protein M431DRAFT_490556 [Trichoderma harzianum CBS 226.95]